MASEEKEEEKEVKAAVAAARVFRAVDMNVPNRKYFIISCICAQKRICGF